MASSMSIFVASDMRLEDFVREVESLLKLQFQRQQDQYETWYETVGPRGRTTVGTHDFEIDRNMNFEDFNYEIAFWVNRQLDEDSIEQVRQETGRQIFDAFRRTDKYQVMLVDDVQVKLDEYHSQQGNTQ
jgi:hypothetical protein